MHRFCSAQWADHEPFEQGDCYGNSLISPVTDKPLSGSRMRQDKQEFTVIKLLNYLLPHKVAHHVTSSELQKSIYIWISHGRFTVTLRRDASLGEQIIK